MLATAGCSSSLIATHPNFRDVRRVVIMFPCSLQSADLWRSAVGKSSSQTSQSRRRRVQHVEVEVGVEVDFDHQ